MPEWGFLDAYAILGEALYFAYFFFVNPRRGDRLTN